MRFIRIIVLLLVGISFSNFTYAQDSQRNFSQIVQSYYLHKDKDLVEKTIAFVNNPQADYKRLEPILTGFFGALFSVDTAIKSKFLNSSERFENQNFKQLFTFLNITNIDSIYSKAPISPAFNDMNWSSYFATGDLKFLDKILSNVSLAENRIDRDLFLTGATAKWSLCSNARQDKQVKEHLSIQENNKKAIAEILDKEPQVFQQEMIGIIRDQRAKGMWK